MTYADLDGYEYERPLVEELGDLAGPDDGDDPTDDTADMFEYESELWQR